MAPRDVFDVNPMFGGARWETYLQFVRDQLGRVHPQEMDESEYDPSYESDGDEEIAEDAWDARSIEEFVIHEDDEERENRIAEIMEFLDSLGPDVGTRENPIDLTVDSD